MQVDSVLINMENHILNANVIKSIVIARLLEDGVIDEDQANE